MTPAVPLYATLISVPLIPAVMLALVSVLTLALTPAVPPAFSADLASLRLHGTLTQGGSVVGKLADSSTQLWLNGKPIQVSPEGDFILGFGRTAAVAQKLTVQNKDGTTSQHTLALKKRTYATQHIRGVPQALVTPPKHAWQRIQKESRLKKNARRKASKNLGFRQNFIWPARGTVTGVYGSQRFYNGTPKRPHYGIDIALPTGTPVLAPAQGIVRLAARDFYFEGGVIFLDHGHGLISAFLHLSALAVQEGDTVQQGDILARSGATGRSTGPHLDWRVSWQGVPVDPALLLG